ncbi:hypothetical protein F2Q70_00039486 [Brassica cretica]|uniref:Uncharacterized protein n=1 Tax=Brassica cretica TaxID=69181 RepID=A0A8S9K807_BRACR|nr:hypothetical protein F2Q70_00039486 [Brassica cretica]
MKYVRIFSYSGGSSRCLVNRCRFIRSIRSSYEKTSSYGFKSYSSCGDPDRDETREGSIQSRRRELRGRDEGRLVDPTRRTGELDDLIDPTRPFGELDGAFGPTCPFGELDDGCFAVRDQFV